MGNVKIENNFVRVEMQTVSLCCFEVQECDWIGMEIYADTWNYVKHKIIWLHSVQSIQFSFIYLDPNSSHLEVIYIVR